MSVSNKLPIEHLAQRLAYRTVTVVAEQTSGVPRRHRLRHCPSPDHSIHEPLMDARLGSGSAQ